MSINSKDATDYLQYHNDFDKWDKLDDEKKENLLQTAESYINSMDLRKDVKDTSAYKHAVYEQAMHMLTFDKERLQLQREGVTSYKFDDMNFIMTNAIISPVVKQLLHRYIFKRLGEIT